MQRSQASPPRGVARPDPWAQAASPLCLNSRSPLIGCRQRDVSSFLCWRQALDHAECSWGVPGVSRKESGEVRGFAETQPVREDGDWLLRLREEAVCLQGNPCIDHRFHTLPGGCAASSGQCPDRVAEPFGIVRGLVSGHVRTFEFGPGLCKKGVWRVARQVQGCEPGKTEQKYSQRGSLSQVRVTSVLPAICGLGEGCRLVSHIMRSEQVPRTTVLEGAWSALAGFGCPGRPARGLPRCPHPSRTRAAAVAFTEGRPDRAGDPPCSGRARLAGEQARVIGKHRHVI